MWELSLHWLIRIILLVGVLGGLLLVPFSLPGTWLIALLGIIYSLFYSFDGGATTAFWVNGWLLGLAAFGEIMEFVVGVFGGKVVKVSTGAIIAAFIGGIAGLIIGVPIFLVGSLIGMFLGAFLGALIYEWVVLKAFGRAVVTACTVLTTRLVAVVLKTFLAAGMAVFLFLHVF